MLMCIQACGLYPTNNAETNKFIIEDCKANILVLEDEKMLRAIEPYFNQLPHLRTIIIYDGKVPENAGDNVLSWKDVMKLGSEDTGAERQRVIEQLNERQRNMAINQCCALVYTSGTTGNPKGRIINELQFYDSISEQLQYLATANCILTFQV